MLGFDLVALLEAPSTCFTGPPTLLTLAADLPPLSRSSSLSLDPPRGHLARVPAQAAAAKPPRPKRPPSDTYLLPPGPAFPKLQSIAL